MKDIFSYNADVNKTAYMNWRTSHHDHIYNMIVIADGFMNSAIMLAETALIDNWDKKADSLIYPIIFNANHAIELYLKATVWTLNILLDNQQKIEGQHDIQQILQTVIKRVQEFETDKEKRKKFKNMINARGQFQDASYVPAAGDIIFFDWENDGTIDHVGIVESVTDGVVNTIEGNSGDKVARKSYNMGSDAIYGYGVPCY